MVGYSFQTEEIINPQTLGLALIVTAAIFLIRFIILYLARIPIMPLLYIAPRGLITILLFFAIPSYQVVPMVNKSLIIQIIIITSVIMMLGMMLNKKPEVREQKEIDEQLAPGSNLENMD